MGQVQATMTEGELVERAVGGDRDAFRVIYEVHIKRIYAHLLWSTRSVDDAEELTQEVFITAWQKLHQFRGRSSLATWLTAVALSAYRSWNRSKNRRSRPVGLVHDSYADCEPEYSAELLMDLDRGIADLPPRARQVVILHDLLGFKHEEIAGAMRTSVGTSKAQLHRGRKLLRKAIER